MRRLIALMLTATFSLTVNAQELPSLGGGLNGTSIQEEQQLGDTWVRILRGRANLLEDPATQQYLEDLTRKLASYSPLQNKRFNLVTLDNASLNAFAVPGGILGVHSGLLTQLDHEDELASVLAHELAHLSQRHYAQQQEESRLSTPLLVGAMIAGAIIGSQTDLDLGQATFSTGLAASAQRQLAFSRRYEREADRIGIQTLAASGFDANAMPRAFQRLQRNARFSGSKPPEFLLTHPVNEARIADAMNRASQLAHQQHSDSLDFLIIRARTQVHHLDEPSLHWQDFDQQNSPQGLYASMLAATAAAQYPAAQKAWHALPEQWQQHPYVQLSYAHLMQASGQPNQADKIYTNLNDLYPNTYPVQFGYALWLIERQQGQRAAALLEKITQNRPDDSQAWYWLAEAYGQAGQTQSLHLARTRFFLLTARADAALQQIDFARRDKAGRFTQARLDQLENQARQLLLQLKNL